MNCEYSGLNLVESNPSTPKAESPKDGIGLLDFHRYGELTSKDGPLSFFAIVNLDPFVKNVLHVMRDNKKLPLKIQNELTRSKRKTVVFLSRPDLFEAIKPYITNTAVVWSLIDHFFESEVFNSCSFFQRDEFTKELINYIGPKSYPAVRNRIDSTFDFIFIGTLLVILRMSSWSYYNAGYETEFYPIGVEAIDLAKQCYEEVRDTYHYHKTHLLQFILILDFYRSNCPEEIDYVEGCENAATCMLAFKHALGLGLNLEGTEEHLKRLWYHIVELDTNIFLKDGNASCLVNEKMYVTALPQEPNDSTIFIRERFRVREKIKPLIPIITDVRLKPSIEDLEYHVKNLEQYLVELNFDSLLTIPNKTEKAAKFLNFLDISSFVYMILYHIFVHYTSVNTQKAFETMARLLNISNPVLQSTHFLDSSKEHAFNLQEQFGSTFNMVPKILMTLHKFLQLQISLIGRTNFILPKTKLDFSFEEIRRISFQNARILIANFGKVSNRYFYAKRMNMIQTVLFVNTFGTNYDSPISPAYLKLLDQDNKIIDSKVLTELVELNQAKNITKEQQKLPAANFDDMMDIVLDEETIEQLEQMLNDQSFLY